MSEPIVSTVDPKKVSRKLLGFLLVFGALALMFAAVLAWKRDAISAEVLITFGLLHAANYAIYSAGNVLSKLVIGQHFQAEFAGKKDGP